MVSRFWEHLLGSTKFVSSIMEERVREERRLWEAIPFVPDLQCAWQNLLQSASPRANRSLRTMPPSASEKYARERDEGIWTTVEALLNEVPGSEQELTDAAQVASLPMCRGGLGLRRIAHDQATHTSSCQRSHRRVAAGDRRDQVHW